MSDYPALTAMGIQNPEQVARFAVFMTDNTDVLHIIYDRKKGSLLPVSKKFRFVRLAKPQIVDSGTRKTEMVYESSAEFRNALTELERLTSKRKDSGELKKMLQQELRTLEEESASRIAYIRQLIDQIK
jgi:DNA-binding transcriptional regulator/RsmH inhibitor MraZ